MKRNGVGVLLALVMAGLAGLAIGCASGVPATSTPATTSPEATLGARALGFDKLEVDLGTVTRDQQGTQTFLVMNWGDRPLHVGPVSIQVEQGCDEVEAVEEDTQVQPGEVFLLPIKLGQHRKLGPHQIRVTVPTNDPARPLTTLSLRFDVVEEPPVPETGPRLRVDKEVIDIGKVPYDWPLYEQFTLHNAGDAPLVLEGVPVVRVEEGC